MGRKKTPPPPKPCGWCKELIYPKGRSPLQFELIKTCGSGLCKTQYRHYKCNKDEIPEHPIKFCLTCNTQLQQRPDERDYSYNSRRYCNKKCIGGVLKVRPPTAEMKYFKRDVPDIEEKSHCMTYQRDSEEFKRIAALYR